MTLPIRTGVIGVGNIGQHHARIYASLPDSHLVGIADIHPGRAQEIADRYQVPAYADYRALLDQVQAVSVAAPTTLHHEIGMACLEHGVHLLMEKPLAALMGQGHELAALIRRRHPRTLWPLVIAHVVTNLSFSVVPMVLLVTGQAA